MSPDRAVLDIARMRIERAFFEKKARLLIVGLCGAQGSGKSTLASGLAGYFDERGIATAILSLDDLYRTRSKRDALALEVHPLLRTRGVPGTHDMMLGLSVLRSIEGGSTTPLPRFDKSIDDRAPTSEWTIATPETRLILLEGWCVGARPQPASDLAIAINDLERVEDVDGAWRRYVNTALAGDYEALFSKIDLLVLLAAPTFETVFRWRIEQERKLRARTGRGMTDEEVIRFVRHFERITRHILLEMPGRADLLIQLDESRRPILRSSRL